MSEATAHNERGTFNLLIYFGCDACSPKHRFEPVALRHDSGWRGIRGAWRLLIPAADQKLEISQRTIAELLELRERAKYVDMPGTIYNGMKPESSRLLAEEQLNQLIDRLRDGLPSKPSKKFVLAQFAKTTIEFEADDTEDL